MGIEKTGREGGPKSVENNRFFDLCPDCEAQYKAQGKLADKAVNSTNGNPCSDCGSQAARCTQYMDAAERARFEAEMEKKAKEMMNRNKQ